MRVSTFFKIVAAPAPASQFESTQQWPAPGKGFGKDLEGPKDLFN
jgi:hypothetical protein